MLEHQLPRRSFLKGLLGLSGAVAAGSFVVHDPQVIAGDLLVPGSAPTILKATSLPEVVATGGEAIITSIDISTKMSMLGLGYDTLGYDTKIELRLFGLPDRELMDAIHRGDTVRLFVVKKGER